MEKEEKPEWYNGRFYQRFISPWLKEIRNTIFNVVEENSIILDVGCGTGELAFTLSKKSKKVIGIDMSKKMIKSANEKKRKLNIKNTQFLNEDGINFLKETDEKFDYVIFSLSLHEMPMEKRIALLKQAKKKTKKIIIADITVPRPINSMKLIIYFIEFLAGREHFKNYKEFIKSGGIENLLESVKLTKESEEMVLKKVYKVVTLK
jgi:ubiquinone/menaquinone biosynthesis C-methylase UbiE